MWAGAAGPYLPNLRHDPWGLISFISRAVGFLLVFVSALVMVAAVSYPGGCYNGFLPGSACGTTWQANAAGAILLAKLLVVLGLGAIGFGAAVKLHYGLRASNATSADDGRWMASERRANMGLFIMSIVLMVVIALSVNALPAFP
jgi:hypothetical protein